MKLLDDETLERSAVVANCRMNREYLGADDRAGPNSTGQAAVNSYYEIV
jgi:hypothetical protein